MIAQLDRTLEGRKGLVVGIANAHSIAYGCARAFRALGAELAVTYLNDKARPHVEPLAQELQAPIFLPCDVQDDAQVDALSAAHSRTLGPARLRPARRCIRAQAGPPGPADRLVARGIPDGDGHLLPLIYSAGAAPSR